MRGPAAARYGGRVQTEDAFIEACAVQLGAAGTGRVEAEWRGEVVALMQDAMRDDGDDAVRALVADPWLLAVVFQNVDLLYSHRSPAADAVGNAVMRALQHLPG